jgi:23S rRNA pseudouridine2605 synthase
MSRKKATSRQVRLQRFLSDSGVASRRRAEELIEAGRVLVNDAIVDCLPAFVDPARDRVVVDGVPARIKPPEYFLMHKPKGVVCTNRDPGGRLRAVDLLPPTKARLNVVGRLDADSTGLLLLTNDGELAEQISHPRLGVPKVYRVEVRGQVPSDIVARMKKGVHLAEGKATASEVEVVHRSRQSSVLKVTLREGRNRQVRRMLARLGHTIKTLKRVQIGPLHVKGLPVGACRRLTTRELAELRRTIRAAKSTRKARAASLPRPQATTPSARTSKRAPRTDAAKRGGKPSRRGQATTAKRPKPRRRLVT